MCVNITYYIGYIIMGINSINTFLNTLKYYKFLKVFLKIKKRKKKKKKKVYIKRMDVLLFSFSIILNILLKFRYFY